MGRPAVPRRFSRWASGSVATSDAWDSEAARPRASSEVRAAPANGVRLANWRPTAEALWPSSVITGVPWSASVPRSAISGRSWRRNDGKRWKVARISAARWALATETVFAWVTKPEICRRSRASGERTASELVASWASARFWPARILSTLSVLPSAGLARWMTALRSEPRAARPVPSSLMMTASDWRTGSREMFCTRSESTGELVRATGSR